MITAIILRGCGEQVGNRNSLPWWVANRLDPKRFEIQECPYDASIASSNPQGNPQGVSLAESTRRAMPMLDKMVRATPNLVLLLTYSQGSYTASKWLARKPADCIVPWAYLFANPLRPEGICWDRPGVPGFGIAGQRPRRIPGTDIKEIALAQDGITALPGDSRLRTVADVVDPLSFALGGGWVQGLAKKTMHADWQRVLTRWPPQPVDPAAFMLRYWRDAQFVDGYLRGTAHGADYWTEGCAQRTVDHINRTVK